MNRYGRQSCSEGKRRRENEDERRGLKRKGGCNTVKRGKYYKGRPTSTKKPGENMDNKDKCCCTFIPCQ